MLKWNDSNHDVLLFSNESHVVYFISLDGIRLQKGGSCAFFLSLAHILRSSGFKPGANLILIVSKTMDLLPLPLYRDAPWPAGAPGAQ